MKHDPRAAAGDLFDRRENEARAVKPPPGRTLFERMTQAARGQQDPNGYMAETMPARVDIDQAAGIDRGIDGSNAAMANADGQTTVGTSTWSAAVWAFATSWVSVQPGDFAVEDIRADYEALPGAMRPPSNNAWGAIGRQIHKIAEPTGQYRAARIKSSNGRAVALYRPRRQA